MDGKTYIKGFIPYGLAAFLIGIVGGFSTVLGPAFVKDIGIAYSNTTWTALVQAMSTAACAPILGKLGDVIGRRKTLLLGIIVYTIGNLLTVFAYSLPFMLLARFTVGVGTAAMTPVIMAFIVTEFPKDKIAKGFSVYMLISSASVIFGPTVGSIIVSALGWRAMIWLCVAICILILAACILLGRGEISVKRAVENFDGVGALFVVVFFSLALCIPSFGQNFGWTSYVFLPILIATVFSLLGLIFAEKRAENPILPGGFMKRKAFILSVITLFLTQGLMQANMTNTIVFVNYTQPNNTVVAGLAISVMYLGMSLGAILLGPLADKIEPKSVLAGSLILTATSCGILFLFSTNTPVFIIMSALGILGLGLGGNATILMKVVLSGLSPETAGAGTGTYGLFRDLAAPFGVAVFVPMFTNRISIKIADGISEADAAVDAVYSLAGAEILCVALAFVLVLLLPKIHNKKEELS